MIGLVSLVAAAGPVLGPSLDEIDPLQRCVEAAQTEAGLDGALAAPDGTPPPSLSGPVDRIAVVVGVPCHRDPTIPSLQYSTRDAVRVAAVLEDAGFAVVPLLTVVDRHALFATLDDAERALAPDGTLLVYFSGHGMLQEGGGSLRRYLVLSDTEVRSIRTTGVPVRDLEERIGTADATTRVLIQDTCFAHRGGKSITSLPSGEGDQEKGMLPLEPTFRPTAGEIRLYASRFFESATESVALRSSVYTAHLLGALSAPGSDLDGDGCTGLLEAHAWARDRTEADRGGLQVPIAAASGSPNLDLGCVPTAPTHAVIDTADSDRWRIELTQARTRDRFEAGAVPPGRYDLSVGRLATEDGALVRQRVYDGPIRLAAGDWLEIEREIARRKPTVAVRATAHLLRSRTLPQTAYGIEVVRSERDRGGGRWIWGASARASPGPGPDQVAKRLVEGFVAGGFAWSAAVRPRDDTVQIAFAPQIAAGFVRQTPYGPDKVLQPAVGPVGEASASIVASARRGSLRLGFGARIAPLLFRESVSAQRLAFDVAPVATVAAGVAW